jgi:hypothetical protein
MSARTPAQLYALVIGASLTAGGIIGLFYSSAFGAPGHTRDVFGVLTVNGYHDFVHLLTGLAGLATASYARAARAYAGWLGLVYVAVAIYGFALGSTGNLVGIVPVNIADDVLHSALGLLGIAAWLGSHEKAPVASRLV